MLADITITIPTQVIHAAAWFAIGAGTVVAVLIALDIRAQKKQAAANDWDWFTN